jgi:hypothetical protein
MDTYDKFFALQQSLSKDLGEIQKEINKARFKIEKAYLQSKFDAIKKVYEQVSDIILPY